MRPGENHPLMIDFVPGDICGGDIFAVILHNQFPASALSVFLCPGKAVVEYR